MRIKLYFSVCFLIISQYAFADAMPKGYQKYIFDIAAKIDSIMIQESDDLNFSTYDTLKSHWRYSYVHCTDNQCMYSGNRYKKYQRIVLFSNENQIVLPAYKPLGSNPSFVITKKESVYKITETTGFLFRGKTGEIIRALLITLFLELLVALIFFRSFIKKMLLYIVLVNCVSLPVAWLVFDALIPVFEKAITLIFLEEVLIVVFEFYALKYLLRQIHTPTPKLLLYCFVANLVSFILGGLLYIISTFI